MTYSERIFLLKYFFFNHVFLIIFYRYCKYLLYWIHFKNITPQSSNCRILISASGKILYINLISIHVRIDSRGCLLLNVILWQEIAQLWLLPCASLSPFFNSLFYTRLYIILWFMINHNIWYIIYHINSMICWCRIHL